MKKLKNTKLMHIVMFVCPESGFSLQEDALTIVSEAKVSYTVDHGAWTERIKKDRVGYVAVGASGSGQINKRVYCFEEDAESIKEQMLTEMVKAAAEIMERACIMFDALRVVSKQAQSSTQGGLSA